jgi:uncharacterized protein YbjT (DUF2867 family)
VIFVTGATGKVGRHVVSGLLERDAAVRALARDPDTADLPEGVDVVSGDLKDPTGGVAAQLDGADAMFPLSPFFGDEGAAEVVDALASNAGRIVYLSAEAAGGRPDSFWAAVEYQSIRNLKRSTGPGRPREEIA